MNQDTLRRIICFGLPLLAAAAVIYYFCTADFSATTPAQPNPEINPPELSSPPADSKQPALENNVLTPEPNPENNNVLPTQTEQPPNPVIEDLSPDSRWKDFLARDYIRIFAVLLDEAAAGCIPEKSLGEYKSPLPFNAVQVDDTWRISPETSSRYTWLINLYTALDPLKTYKVLSKLKPAVDIYLQSMGYPENTADSMIQTAAEAILTIPDIQEDEPLLRLDDNLYQWQNPALEALTPFQKCLLRLGPDNLKRMKAQTSQILHAGQE